MAIGDRIFEIAHTQCGQCLEMRRDELGGGKGAHAKQRCSSLITRCVQMRAFALLAVAVQTVTAAPAQFEAESDWPPPPRGSGGLGARRVEPLLRS